MDEWKDIKALSNAEIVMQLGNGLRNTGWDASLPNRRRRTRREWVWLPYGSLRMVNYVTLRWGISWGFFAQWIAWSKFRRSCPKFRYPPMPCRK